jgi:hypothetical protein
LRIAGDHLRAVAKEHLAKLGDGEPTAEVDALAHPHPSDALPAAQRGAIEKQGKPELPAPRRIRGLWPE